MVHTYIGYPTAGRNPIVPEPAPKIKFRICVSLSVVPGRDGWRIWNDRYRIRGVIIEVNRSIDRSRSGIEDRIEDRVFRGDFFFFFWKASLSSFRYGGWVVSISDGVEGFFLYIFGGRVLVSAVKGSHVRQIQQNKKRKNN